MTEIPKYCPSCRKGEIVRKDSLYGKWVMCSECNYRKFVPKS